MNADEFIETIKKGERYPIYLLHGEEPYFIDQISTFIQDNMLNETEQVFNMRVFYGKETDFRTVLDEARQYPMMSSHRLILIREAQEMRGMDEMEAYFENPVSSTILVLCYKYKKFDQRTRAAKAIKQNGILFESKPLYENQVPDWILKEAFRKGIKIAPDACHLMAEYLGTDLGSIIQAIEKIKISANPDEVVTAKDLDELIGIHKDFNVFELQKAIGQRDTTKAFRIIHYFEANPKASPMVMILANLYAYISKLFSARAANAKNDQDLMAALQLKSPFFLREYKEALKHFSLPQLEHALFLLREYDLKYKGVNSRGIEEGALLKELVSRLLM